jgi:hypothetical protein
MVTEDVYAALQDAVTVARNEQVRSLKLLRSKLQDRGHQVG